MARKKKEKPKSAEQTLLEEAKDRFELALNAWDDNRKQWLADVKFAAGEQWPEEIKKLRQLPGEERPCLVVDKIGQYERQIVNDGRQNRQGVKVLPVADGHVDVAEAFEGVIRNIWNTSKGDQAADTALGHAVKGGFGYIRLTTEYAYPGTFEQTICIKRVRNPLAVLVDPNFQEADGSDIAWGFVIDEIPKDQFKADYPKAQFTDWDFDAEKYSDGWLENGKDGNVRICEYFYKVETPETVHLLIDNTTICDDDYQRDTKEQLEVNPQFVPTAIKESREIPDCEVKWCRMTGAEILEQNDWMGRYIPIIPVLGNEEDIEGKVTYSGIYRKAKDAQMLYNFARSAFAETVAMQPKAPFIGEADAVADYLDDWQGANKSNLSMLRYKGWDAEGGRVIPPPQRVMPPTLPGAFAQDAQMAEHDIQAALGMYAASVGQPSNEKSGRAILARQHEGDTSTFHYTDNQARAIGYLGVQLVDLIPKVIDSKRTIRMLGEDGQATTGMVDPEQQQPVMQGPNGMKIYNFNAGRYDVTVSTGASYSTKRQESVEAMMQLTQSYPPFLQVAGDIFVRNQDWPGAQEIADRLKKMLPPQLQDGPDQMPPEVQQAMQQVQQAHAQLMEQQQQMQQAGQQLAQDKATNDADKAKLEAMKQGLDSKAVILEAKFQELSAKLELQAMKAAQVVPPQMPPGKDEPAIAPDAPQPQPTQAPSGAFFTPGE